MIHCKVQSKQPSYMRAGLVAPPALPAAVSPLSPPAHNPLNILSSLPLPQTIIHKVTYATMMKGSKSNDFEIML